MSDSNLGAEIAGQFHATTNAIIFLTRALLLKGVLNDQDVVEMLDHADSIVTKDGRDETPEGRYTAKIVEQIRTALVAGQ